MSEALKKIDEYKYKLLRELLSKCTEKQQKFFDRLYPEGIENIKYGNFNTAIKQVERTIEKNGDKTSTKYNRFEIMDI